MNTSRDITRNTNNKKNYNINRNTGKTRKNKNYNQKDNIQKTNIQKTNIQKSKKMNKVNIFTDNSNNYLQQDKKGDWVYKYYRKEDDSTFNKDSNRCMCINYKSINDFNTYDRCTNNKISGTDFCSLHQDCKSYLRNFLSGDEYDFDKPIWSDPLIEGSHNCYSYFPTSGNRN